MTLLIRHLEIQRSDGVRLLAPFDLVLSRGGRVALVGESGSGKSLLVQALFGALPPGVRQTKGHLEAFGTPLFPGGPSPGLAWVPQDPLSALNPLVPLGDHLTLLPRVHRGEGRKEALRRLGPLLEALRLPQDSAFLRRVPQEISGGQRQRLVLAMALSWDPELLILDEPTTALDPALQGDVLALLEDLRTQRGLGWLWITHDLEVAGAVAEQLVILYGGERLEAGPTRRILQQPAHPYTQRLLAAARGEASPESGFLEAPERRPVGCPFQPRCPQASPACARWGVWRGSLEAGLRCEAG